MADPFILPGQPQTEGGLAGISPDSWRNLMMFGANLATAANARNGQGFLTYGNGIAGPLGAATQGTMEGAQRQANLMSELDLRRQQITSSKLQNQLTAMQLPFMQQKLKMLADLGSGGGAVPDDTSAGTPATPSGNYSDLVIGHEGLGQNARSSANGYGQFNKDTWMDFAKANPQYFQQGSDPAQILSVRGNRDVAKIATDWLGERNTPALKAAGIDPTNGAKGLAHFLGPAAAVAMWKADPTASAAAIIQSVLPADTAKEYLKANPKLARQTAGDVVAPYRRWDAAGASAAGGAAPPPAQGGVPGQGAVPAPEQRLLSRANALFNTARQKSLLGVPAEAELAEARKLLEIAYAGPEAGAKASATLETNITEKLAAAGFQRNKDGSIAFIPGGPADPAYQGKVKQSQAANENFTLRQGEIGRVQQPNGANEWIGAPKLETTQDATGATSYQFVTPPVPGGTAQTTPAVGPDGKPVVKEQSPSYLRAQKDFHEVGTKDYMTAQNAQGWLQQANSDAEALNAAGGWYSTGPFAPVRQKAAQVLNDFSRTMGLSAPANEEALAHGESLIKTTKTAGFELASKYEGHARQAAATIMQATQAIPGLENSPLGFRLVSNSINEGAQFSSDLHNYKQSVLNDPTKLPKAETEFTNRFPPMAYARRAQSTVRPIEIKSESEVNRLLPGTWFTVNGGVFQVGEREGAPPIPAYMYGMPPPTPAARR